MRKFLVALAAVSIGIGGALLSRLENGTTLAELQDAGFAQCPVVDLACEVRVSDEWLDRLEARGSDAGKRYRRVVMDGRDCRNLQAGLVITDRRFYRDGGWTNGFEVIDGRCRIVTDGPADDGGTGLREAPLECGCRRASGTCRYRNDAGTLVTAPLGRTLGPGYPPFEEFSGAGCARKACVEFAGETSWPESCPGG